MLRLEFRNTNKLHRTPILITNLRTFFLLYKSNITPTIDCWLGSSSTWFSLISLGLFTIRAAEMYWQNYNIGIHIDGDVLDIDLVGCVRGLGVQMDSGHDMRFHTRKCRFAFFFHLWRRRHLRHTSTSHGWWRIGDVGQGAVSALILSRIDCHNVVFTALYLQLHQLRCVESESWMQKCIS